MIQEILLYFVNSLNTSRKQTNFIIL